MKRGGWTGLRRWMLVGALLELFGLILHFVGGRPWDVVWLFLTIAAAVVFVVGYYRHPLHR